VAEGDFMDDVPQLVDLSELFPTYEHADGAVMASGRVKVRLHQERTHSVLYLQLDRMLDALESLRRQQTRFYG
jgi:hypothetical protein